MINNRARQEITWISPKKFQMFLRRLKNSKYLSVFWHFGTHFVEISQMSKLSWIMEPTYSHEMPSCSDINLGEIWRSTKNSSWICSIISGVLTVRSRPGRGATQVKTSPRLNWVIQFLTVAYNGACSPDVSVRMAWISFGASPCRKITCWQLVSRCCWNRALRLTCLLSSSVTRKEFQFGTRTHSSLQRHYWFRSMKWRSRSV